MEQTPALSRHAKNSARTREKIIQAAEVLYGSRGIDAVSLSEITAAAGQRNRNALQYHFGSRQGLLQSITDRHAARVARFRKPYLEQAAAGQWPAAEAAARCLAMPIVDYLESDASAVNYVLVTSQLLATLQQGTTPAHSDAARGVQFARIPALSKLFAEAMQPLPTIELQRRVYLAVNTTFHCIADIYRGATQASRPRTLVAKKPMVEQLVCLLEAFFSAPPRR